MFARGAGAEVFAADDDRVFALEFPFGDKADVAVGQARLCRGNAAHGVHAKELAFFGKGGVEGEILGRDDLVGIDVIAQNIGFTGNDGFHEIPL
jgi:hypothetical protein